MNKTLKTLLKLSPLRHAIQAILAAIIFITLWNSPSNLEEGYGWLLVIILWSAILWVPLGIVSLVMNILAIVFSKKEANITPFLIVHLICKIIYEFMTCMILVGLFSMKSPILIIESVTYFIAEIAYNVLIVLFIVGSVKDNKRRKEERAKVINIPVSNIYPAPQYQYPYQPQQPYMNQPPIHNAQQPQNYPQQQYMQQPQQYVPQQQPPYQQ